MFMLLQNLALTAIWVILTGDTSWPNIFLGFLLGYFLLGFLGRVMGASSYFSKFWVVIGFILFFIKSLLQAGWRVFRILLAREIVLRPAVVAIPLEVGSAAAITLLGNLITLTPGTLTLDVSADRQVMYVHTIDMEDVDDFRRGIKEGFERRVIEVMR